MRQLKAYVRRCDESVGLRITRWLQHDVVLWTFIRQRDGRHDVRTEINPEEGDTSEAEGDAYHEVEDERDHLRHEMGDRVRDGFLEIVKYQPTCVIGEKTRNYLNEIVCRTRNCIKNNNNKNVIIVQEFNTATGGHRSPGASQEGKGGSDD